MKKKIIIIISILLVVTAIIASVYAFSRPKIESGSILLTTASGDITINFNELSLSKVEGETVNKKGETKKISTTGYPMSDIPSLAGITEYSELSVFSDDEYHADILKDELAKSDRAWLIREDDSIRLVVFGDSDSKRNVKNVVRIEIRSSQP